MIFLEVMWLAGVENGEKAKYCRVLARVLARYIGILLDQLLQSVKFTIVVFHLNILSGYLGFSCGSRKEKQITWIRCFSHLISIHFSSCSLLILEIFLYHTLQFWNMPKCFYLNSSDKNNQLKQRKVYNWSIALNIQLSVTVRAHAMHTVHSNTCICHMKETIGTLSNMFNNYSTSTRCLWDDR